MKEWQFSSRSWVPRNQVSIQKVLRAFNVWKTNLGRQLPFFLLCSVLQARHYFSQVLKGYFCDIGLNQRVRSICHMSLSFPISRIYNIINHLFMSFYLWKGLGMELLREYTMCHTFLMHLILALRRAVHSNWCILILNHFFNSKKKVKSGRPHLFPLPLQIPLPPLYMEILFKKKVA